MIQIPPPPPRPDFEASKEKLRKLSEGEQTMTKEEFNKMKEELEASVFDFFLFLCSIIIGKHWKGKEGWPGRIDGLCSNRGARAFDLLSQRFRNFHGIFCFPL